MLDAGIASSWHIAQFFGLTKQAPIRAAPKDEPRGRQSRPQQPRADQDHRSKRRDPSARGGLDVSGAITRALKATGLIK
jgi:hypothetical protein